MKDSAPTPPATTSKAGRDLPAAIAVSLLLGGIVVSASSTTSRIATM